MPDKNGLTRKEQHDRPTYFNISKNLFFFFMVLYGGGPVICKHDEFRKYEMEDEGMRPDIVIDPPYYSPSNPPKLDSGIVGM